MCFPEERGAERRRDGQEESSTTLTSGRRFAVSAGFIGHCALSGSLWDSERFRGGGQAGRGPGRLPGEQRWGELGFPQRRVPGAAPAAEGAPARRPS